MFKKLLPIFFVLVAIVAVWYWWPGVRGNVAFTSQGSTRTEAFKSCAVGFGSQPTLFGVHLKTTQGSDVFVHDSALLPSLPARIEITSSEGALTTIDPQSCSKFAANLSWGEGNIYSDTRSHVSGKISFLCPSSSGILMQVDAELQRCSLK